MGVRVRAACLAVALCGPAQAQYAPCPGPGIEYYAFRPPVVIPGQTTQVHLEVKPCGTAARLTLDTSLFLLNASVTDLRDDGAGGDQKGGDGIFTIRLDPAAIKAGVRPDINWLGPFLTCFYRRLVRGIRSRRSWMKWPALC